MSPKLGRVINFLFIVVAVVGWISFLVIMYIEESSDLMLGRPARDLMVIALTIGMAASIPPLISGLERAREETSNKSRESDHEH